MTKVGKKLLFLAVAAACAMACGVVIVASCGRKDTDKAEPADELFISVDYRQMINEAITLPFVYEMQGEHSIVKIVLDRLDRVYPDDGRIAVVLEGSAGLYGIGGQDLRETFPAAIRFLWKPCCIDSVLSLAEEPVLARLSVYSSDLDVEAIVERCGGACWKAFCSTISGWEMPLQSMPFTPARHLQLEEDGVFVFEGKQ